MRMSEGETVGYCTEEGDTGDMVDTDKEGISKKGRYAYLYRELVNRGTSRNGDQHIRWLRVTFSIAHSPILRVSPQT